MAWSQVQRRKYEKLLQSKPVNSSSAPVVPGANIGNEQGLIRDSSITGPLIRDSEVTGPLVRDETVSGVDVTKVPVTNKKDPNERWTVDDMIKIIDKSAESQKGIISDLLKQQFGYGSAKKLRDTIIDAPLIEAELMAMQADREVENLKAVPKLTINPNMRPDNFNYTQLIHGGRA